LTCFAVLELRAGQKFQSHAAKMAWLILVLVIVCWTSQSVTVSARTTSVPDSAFVTVFEFANESVEMMKFCNKMYTTLIGISALGLRTSRVD
jgi:hypothetical protein